MRGIIDELRRIEFTIRETAKAMTECETEQRDLQEAAAHVEAARKSLEEIVDIDA